MRITELFTAQSIALDEAQQDPERFGFQPGEQRGGL